MVHHTIMRMAIIKILSNTPYSVNVAFSVLLIEFEFDVLFLHDKQLLDLMLQ